MHGAEEARGLGGVIFTGVDSEGHLNPSTENWKLSYACKQINFFKWTEQWNCNLLTASLLKLSFCTDVYFYIWVSFVQHCLALAKWLTDTPLRSPLLYLHLGRRKEESKQGILIWNMNIPTCSVEGSNANNVQQILRLPAASQGLLKSCCWFHSVS